MSTLLLSPWKWLYFQQSTIWTLENAKNSVFSGFWSIVWCFLSTLQAPIEFYFIPNKKYGSFRWFWVPSQLHTTKTRPCGFSQSLWRNEILEKSNAFWSIYQNLIPSQTLREATGTSFCRKGLGRDSQSPERSILFFWNKIKPFWDSQSCRKLSNISNEFHNFWDFRWDFQGFDIFSRSPFTFTVVCTTTKKNPMFSESFFSIKKFTKKAFQRRVSHRYAIKSRVSR